MKLNVPFPFDHFFFCFFPPVGAGAMIALLLGKFGWESGLVRGERDRQKCCGDESLKVVGNAKAQIRVGSRAEFERSV